MTEAKHTPGPWRQSVDRGVEQTTIVTPGDHLVAIASWDVRDQWRHNARLIAAAPDLLEALHDLLNASPDPSGSLTLEEIHDRARAAIAAAAGATAMKEQT